MRKRWDERTCLCSDVLFCGRTGFCRRFASRTLRRAGEDEVLRHHSWRDHFLSPPPNTKGLLGNVNRRHSVFVFGRDENKLHSVRYFFKKNAKYCHKHTRMSSGALDNIVKIFHHIRPYLTCCCFWQHWRGWNIDWTERHIDCWELRMTISWNKYSKSIC